MNQVLLFIPVLFLLTKATPEYYWKEYSDNIVPPDAFPAGKAENGKEVYIGQTYVHNIGMMVMTIFPGETSTNVAAYGVKPQSPVVYILCSKHHDKFSWMTTSAKTFHLDTTGKHPVIGGFDHVDSNKGMLHVGRLTFRGGIRIGSVQGFALENANFVFIGEGKEQKATIYEVLLFDMDNQDWKKTKSKWHCAC